VDFVDAAIDHAFACHTPLPSLHVKKLREKSTYLPISLWQGISSPRPSYPCRDCSPIYVHYKQSGVWFMIICCFVTKSWVS